ncbi:Rad9/DDC1 [Penicillium argentinense]|uniref:DNA repair protein rad9 n=1 Tax=Penicillium argentinense TaxID=1131581 RepID=A0A9W9G5V4_9EURO|nr:Rad9/DDC1 [Penicillium argentinense]KAJ5112458.1 Rad9/DDC1 [Penicillium argentinense]
MASLSLSLDPAALVRLHDFLICLSKFSDTVAIEAEHDRLRLSALNSTKTAFASFVCEKEAFFESYSFNVRRDSRSRYESPSEDSERFYCQILIRALLSIFRGRVDRHKDTAVERCDMELHEDSHQAECRLNVKIYCALGVIKSYKLTYEPAAIQHAVFDRSRTTSQWTACPRFLKQIIEHFSMSAEQLDMCAEGDKATFTSFTTKITDGKEVLKNPVHTSVCSDKKDFEEFLVEDHMHIAINLKDFKAAVAHAETGSATITARYTRPCKPLQLAYEMEGISAEFTLMTRGEVDDEETPSARAVIPQFSQRSAPTPAPISVSRTETPRVAVNTVMPPPPARARSIRPLNGSSTQDNLTPRPTMDRPSASASMEFDSLFVPADDDRQWDEMNDEEEDPQDILGWDASGRETIEPVLRDIEPDMPKPGSSCKRAQNDDDMGLPPTQRMSQVRGFGLFD